MLTLAQMKAQWIAATGDVHDANTMAAIAMAESRGHVNAWNHSDPYGGSYGLWQVNGCWQYAFNPHLLRNDPFYDAQAALYVVRHQGLNAWSTHADGSYLAFMPHHHVGRVAHHAHARHVHVKPADTSYASAGLGCFGFLLIINTLFGKLKKACTYEIPLSNPRPGRRLSTIRKV